MEYFVLMIDLKNSRELSEKLRIESQKKLLYSIEKCNKFFKEIKLKLVFSSGDSIQGLFVNFESALLSFDLIKSYMYPFEIRSCIAQGSIHEKLLNGLNDSNYVDGEVYHKAIAGLELTKAKEFELYIDVKNKLYNSIANQLLRNNDYLYSRMKPKQKEVYNIFTLVYPLNNKIFNGDINDIIKNNVKEYKKINKIKPMNFEIESKFDTKVNSYVAEILNVQTENIRQIVKAGNFNLIRQNMCMILDLHIEISNEE